MAGLLHVSEPIGCRPSDAAPCATVRVALLGVGSRVLRGQHDAPADGRGVA